MLKENKNNSTVNTRFVTKTLDIRNFSENFRSDVKTSQVATLYSTIMQASSEEFYATPNEIGVQYNFKSVYCI